MIKFIEGNIFCRPHLQAQPVNSLFVKFGEVMPAKVLGLDDEAAAAPQRAYIEARMVERTLAWISRNRRLARDFENLASTATALVRLAMIKIMLRHLARI